MVVMIAVVECQCWKIDVSNECLGTEVILYVQKRLGLSARFRKWRAYADRSG